ncbi:MAG: FimV/HubP family polar landmark protein [Pseudohongiellaceae bacterium]
MNTHTPIRAISVSLLAVLLTSQAYAVGVGTTNVESYLNQPLQVRIEIIELEDTRFEDITVALASAEDFQRFGAVRDAANGVLETIRFELIAGASGNYLQLSTTENITEPLLTVVLELRWPTGRLLSEQVLSLVAEPGQISETVQVQVGDSLAAVAERVQPSPTVTLQQTMLALQELNPDAFLNGNINQLQAGRILRVPSLSRIQQINSREARAVVNEQNEAYARMRASTSGTTPAAGSRGVPQGQLSVVTEADAAIPDNNELDQRIAALEAQLALREEEIDRAQIERQELNARMAALEEQIAGAIEIIRLRDIELTRLQQALAEAAQRGSQAEEPSFFDNILNMDFDSLLEMIEDELYDNPMYYWIGGAVGLALLLALILRLRSRAMRFDDDEEDDFDDDMPVADTMHDSRGDGTVDLPAEDETANKLELAYAYQEMGDTERAENLLHEIIRDGDAAQAQEAREMLDSLESD